MSIWQYADTIRDESLIRSAIEFSVCPFCASNLELLHDDSEDRGGHGEYETNVDRYWTCPVCGWWKGYSSYRHTDHGTRSFLELGAAAALRDLDLTDLSLPIEEVRAYLAAKYESRFEVHPRLLELTVASVFRDHGHRTEATAYSNDGGIDVLLTDRDGKQVGVQVKRYRNSIEVEQIRSFAGALLLGGLTKGVFVTTSSFQRGALGVSALAAVRGISIELQDASRFLDSLKVAQRERYRSSSDLRNSVDRSKFTSLRIRNWRKYQWFS